MAKLPKRKEYLNDFKKSDDGSYYYGGKYYEFSGDERAFKKSLILLIILIALLITIIIGSGCVSAGGMKNAFYVIMPYILEVSALFALCWYSFKMLSHGKAIKEYVYKSAHPKIPVIALILAGFSAIGLICSVIFTLINGNEGKPFEAILYPALKAVTALIAFIFNRSFKNLSWEIK